ncbi:MAG: FAD-dependent oxidoreductase [Verrucomicrobiota bacterium]|nr:FAD-dependent oxidoreductase [Verrucomicrobiota bacterium]
MKPRVAVIGSGIAGMSAAYCLRETCQVSLVERNGYAGGHTNTITIDLQGKRVPVDTGFMVFNDTTYPNLMRLFNELEVTSYNTSMSFGVKDQRSGLEYACSGFSSFFAQKRNLANPRHWQLYRDILAFFDAADRLLVSRPSPYYTLQQFAADYELSNRVMEHFAYPMAGAIWSTTCQDIKSFAALPLLRFMKNHNMLGVGIQFQWKTVEGGSDQYKNKLLGHLPQAPQLNRSINGIGQNNSQAYYHDENGERHEFDYVIIAAHANQALALLESPSYKQRSLLESFRYSRNRTVLHSDSSVMPQSRKAWASWNVLTSLEPNGQLNSSTHYWMNSLQNLDTNENVFVSIDYEGSIDPPKIHWSSVYEHPRFDSEAIAAQDRLPEINEDGRLLFCGSYFRNGFHEDALWSALKVVEEIRKREETSNELVSL